MRDLLEKHPMEFFMDFFPESHDRFYKRTPKGIAEGILGRFGGATEKSMEGFQKKKKTLKTILEKETLETFL